VNRPPLESRGLAHRIILQTPVYSQDSYGQKKIASWIDVATVWADVRETSGREISREQQQATVTDATIAVRYRGDIETTWRVKWLPSNRVFNITLKRDPNGDRVWLILECVEVK
jgi:SPP1 family predicted phage head-tail adaptor